MSRRPLSSFWRIGWIDSLVVVAVSLTFAAVVYAHNHRLPGAPPERTVEAMAAELGVTAQELRHATEQVPPPRLRHPPSESQRAEHSRILANTLSVPPARLEAVFEKYLPPRF
ncbi:MAG: hypothetical protein JSR90_07155 [Proteobacteria bacterium]|nr:hypothetical protein [Pseudomonadota bacterium]